MDNDRRRETLHLAIAGSETASASSSPLGQDARDNADDAPKPHGIQAPKSERDPK